MQEQEMPIIMVINKSLITFYEEWHHLITYDYELICNDEGGSATYIL